ncbi:MAG: TIGR03915 family putative DNA repair protein [Clostridium sp.]
MKIFIYDNTFQGLLTAIYHSFYSKEKELKITTLENHTPSFLDEEIIVETNENLSSKVEKSIIEKISKSTLSNIYFLFLSSYENKEILLYNYLKFGFKVGKDVNDMLHLDVVRDVKLIVRRVTLESHRFKGFVRFSYINNEFLYSSISPDHNILELISPHFQKRFSNEYWIIHDKKRGLASIYNKEFWEITKMSDEDYEKLKGYEDEYNFLWKEYFKSVNIEERNNPKLQTRMMPKRYWEDLTEL